jgi:CRP-like cAMP-binding protein
MFVVGRGRIRLTIAGEDGVEKEVNVMKEGDFFGELSLLADAARTATATAVEDSTLLVVGRDVFGMMVQDDLDIVFRMMRAQGRRLSQANVPIQEMTQQLGRVRIACYALRRVLAGPLPVDIDLERLGADVGLPAQAVQVAVNQLAAQGAGRRNDGRWSFTGADETPHLVEAIYAWTEVKGS